MGRKKKGGTIENQCQNHVQTWNSAEYWTRYNMLYIDIRGRHCKYWCYIGFQREREKDEKNVRRKVYFRNKSQVLLRLRLKTIFFWWMVFKTVKHHYSDSDFLQLWLVYSDAWNTLYSIHGSVWFKCWQIREIGLVPEEITNKEATGYTSMII